MGEGGTRAGGRGNLNSADGDDVDSVLKAHINGLRGIHAFSTIPIFFIPESNYGLEASRMAMCLRRFVNVHVVHQRPGAAGVLTDNTEKLHYADMIRERLTTGNIAYLAEMVVTAPDNKIPIVRDDPSYVFNRISDEHRYEARKELENQLNQFKKIVLQPGIPTSRPRMTYSGKTDEDGHIRPGLNDDLVMAIGIALYWSAELRKNKLPTPVSVERVEAPETYT